MLWGNAQMARDTKSNKAKSNRLGDGDEFWLQTSESSLDTVWGNHEDDVYAKLERRDAEGYLKHPQQSDEIDEWQSEQDWEEP